MTTANSAESLACPATDRNYEARATWDVPIVASVEREMVEMASRLLENAPCGHKEAPPTSRPSAAAG